MMQYHTPIASLHQDAMRKLLFELQSQDRDEVDSPFPGLLQALPRRGFGAQLFYQSPRFWYRMELQMTLQVN
jgi:hypothetical protein